MTYRSVINHGNARFFHLRQEYLDICQDHDYTPGKPVRSAVECAAKLLDILILRQNTETSSWLYERIEDFSDALMNTEGRGTILEALKLLQARGFVQSRKTKDPRDQTKEWKLEMEKVDEALTKRGQNYE